MPEPLTLALAGAGPPLGCRAVLFDMDGVLVDSMALITRRLELWAEANGLPPALVVEASHGRTQVDLVRAVTPWLDPVDEARRLAAQEMEDVRHLRACPGALRLLGQLPAGAWAVVTSGYQAIAHARLAAARISRPDVLVCADDVTRGKPDPEGYLRAAAGLGVTPADVVVVEDAPAGVAAGRAAGCRVIGVGDPGLHADVVVGSLAEVTVALPVVATAR